MLKISHKASTNLSLVISVAFFVVLLAGAVMMPVLVKYYAAFLGVSSDYVLRAFFTVVAYAILAVATVANGLLLTLLHRVQSGQVFSATSIALIRGISWCCVAVGLLFFLLSYHFRVAFMIAFAALFLGLCVRVVKNVIEEATEIKSENDLTV